MLASKYAPNPTVAPINTRNTASSREALWIHSKTRMSGDLSLSYGTLSIVLRNAVNNAVRLPSASNPNRRNNFLLMPSQGQLKVAQAPRPTNTRQTMTANTHWAILPRSICSQAIWYLRLPMAPVLISRGASKRDLQHPASTQSTWFWDLFKKGAN